jgi:hypothetical protein
VRPVKAQRLALALYHQIVGREPDFQRVPSRASHDHIANQAVSRLRALIKCWPENSSTKPQPLRCARRDGWLRRVHLILAPMAWRKRLAHHQRPSPLLRRRFFCNVRRKVDVALNHCHRGHNIQVTQA